MANLLIDQLRLMAESLADEAGFVDVATGGRLTFGEWHARSDDLARGLVEHGLGRGERVAIDLPMTDALAWVVTYAGVHKAAAVAVPVNSRFVERELAEVLAHAGASVVVAGGERLARAAEVAGRLPGLRLLVARRRPGVPPAAGARAGPPWPAGGVPAGSASSASDAPAELALGGLGTQSGVAGKGLEVVSWEELAERDGRPFSREVSEDDIADILYTSGTTGRPKGVVVRHCNASIIPNGLPKWTGQGWLSASPLFTFAGISFVYNPMKLGMTALFMPRFDPGAWIEAVERHRPVMVFLVPAMVELLLAHPRLVEADLSSIALCAVGSAPFAPETQRRLQAAMPNATVSNGYGMTEAGSAFTVMPKEEAERRPGSVGRPSPPAEFFVVDDEGRRLPPGEVGELVIKLPGRPREYYQDPEATARTWHEDGLHTGDLARFDEDGYLYIVGRSKDVIIRGGNNIYAGDVEAVLYEHPAVQEAAVAGVEHPVLGEDVAAWVVLKPGAAVSPQELQAFCAERLSDYKVPRHIAFVPALPRNATGKVLKSELPPPAPVRQAG